jgi:hypothetical protein
VTKRSTALPAGVFQGIDLFSNDEDEADEPSLEDALLSGRAITGHYLKEIYTTDADPLPYSGSVTVKRFKGAPPQHSTAQPAGFMKPPTRPRCMLAGKGRALVASSTLAAGELLLVSEPLVVVQGQSTSSPQLSDLFRHLQQSKFSVAEQAVFALLYTGEVGGCLLFNRDACPALRDVVECVLLPYRGGKSFNARVQGTHPTACCLELPSHP